jgi:cell division transport system permease protein
MTVRSFLYLAREGLRSAIRHPALALAAVLSIVASLLVLAITLLFTTNIERHATAIEGRRAIDVYIADGINPETRARLETALTAIKGVARATYVSKEDALAAYRRDAGRYDLIDALGYNPLPASYRLELAENARSGAQMRAIAEAATRLEGTEDVRYGGEWIERLDAALLTLRLVDLAAAVLVGLSVAFAVGSTIRLTMLARREMIEIMKAMGATDGYISAPFLVEGITQSLLAAVAALGLLRLVVAFISSRVGGLQFLGVWELVGFLAFAVVLGLAGAFWSLGAALRRSS